MKLPVAVFGTDSRSLALIRILIGGYFIAHPPWPADAGPESMTFLLLRIVYYAAIIAVVLGYRSGRAAFLGWALSVCIFLFYDAGADYRSQGVAGLLILLACVPSAANYSLDKALGWTRAGEERLVTPGTAALLIQLGLIGSSLAAADTPARSPGMILFVGLVLAIFWLPSLVWEFLVRWTRSFHGDELQIYYDEDCGFCLKTCLIFREFLLLGNTPIMPAQSDPTVEKIMRKNDSWVVFDRDGSVFLRWHAVLLLLRRSAVARPAGRLLSGIGMGHWGDGCYGAIAASRGFLSKISAWLLPVNRNANYRMRGVSLVPTLWIAATVLYNLSTIFSIQVPWVFAVAKLAGLGRIPVNWLSG